MSEIELLEELIGVVEKKKIACLQAREIIEKYGSISNVLREDIKVFENLSMLSKNSRKIFECITKIYRHIIYEECFGEENKISCFEELVKYLKFHYKDMEREVFKILYFNSKNILIKDENIFYGTIDRSIVHVREIVKNTMKYNAKSIIVVHNHPSGSLDPSKDDKMLTEKLKELLEFLDVRLSDHLIISNKGYYSFLENGDI